MECATTTSVGDDAARGRLRGASWRGLLDVLVFGVLPALLMASLFRQRGLGWDFRAFYVGARHYLAGISPYPGHSLAALAFKQGFVYPAPMAALLAPLALLPYNLALALWLAASVGAIAGTVRILGVRDWRCIGVLFLTHPVQQAVRLGTLMPLLAFLLALLWVCRNRIWPTAVLAAVLAVSKIFLFPLLFWLAMTSRIRTAALGAAVALGICVLGWMPLSLSTIVAYPTLLHALASYEQTFSYSLTSFVLGLGGSATTATEVATAVGLGLLLLAAKVRNDDFLVFRLALAASFALSPIVWGHYFVLLIVPLALARPRLSALWVAAIWIKPDTLQLSKSDAWIALALVVLLAQLDLARPLFRWWNRLPRPRTRQTAVAVACVGLLVASNAAAQLGRTATAALRPPSSRADANGIASIRIDTAARQLCWRMWTDNLPARRATLTLANEHPRQKPLVFYTEIGTDGQAHGCGRVNRGDARLLLQRLARVTGYRLSLATREGVTVAGALRGQ